MKVSMSFSMRAGAKRWMRPQMILQRSAAAAFPQLRPISVRRTGASCCFEECPDPDILISNNGGPGTGYLADVDRETWLETLEANMVAPLMLIRAVVPKMKERRFGRIVNITSAMVTTPRPHMVMSAGARAGLTAALKGLSFELAPFNVTVNNMLPERFDTDRQHRMAQATMKRENISYEEARARQVQSIAAKRLAIRRSSALPARSCAVHSRAISPVRTCISTAVPILP